MNKKIIEVVGPSFHNKGDALMACAIEQRLGAEYYLSYGAKSTAPQALRRLAIAINRRLPQSMRGIKYQLAGLLPRSYRLKWQMVNYNDIQSVIDCSGFQYSDQWEKLASRLKWRKEHYRRIKKMGKKIIMLPQAFGPFQKKIVRELILGILESVDLVFARDEISTEYMLSLGGTRARIKTSPDFTNLVEGAKVEDIEKWRRVIAIVPNARMMDMTSRSVGEKYMPFLGLCLEVINSQGLKPVIVVHEKGDLNLALELGKRVGQDMVVVDEEPVITKGILGSCYAVIGSRYHALISALSQGTPTLGAGWTHKYQILFKEYGCPECLVEPSTSEEEVKDKIALITDLDPRTGLIGKIKDRGTELKRRTEAMWREVESLLK
ncbi:MAG: polysaccharide pyruvyl transferase family protein [Thermodesulfobacteriota bacterium]